jgi:4-amino-4-deoxy-L-arabinose transferase-like glycosyltransferase
MRRIATVPAAVTRDRPARWTNGLAGELQRRWFESGVVLCALGVGTFLVVQLTAWPPHEDETLALFVGRKSISGLLDTVLEQRGGAPLHFVFAWIVAHAGGGLVGLRLVSAIFATATVPAVALLASRIAGRATALATTVICSASWMLLFHGVYGRMYSLFLFTSTLSFLALLRAAEQRTRRAWAFWVVAVLLCVAAHPYGALVLATQGVYVVLTRVPIRMAVPAFATVAIVGIPFWRTDLVLAGRFDVGVAQGSTTLASVSSIASYLETVAGDFTAGYPPVITIVLLLALAGIVSLVLRKPRAAMLAAAVVITPLAALIVARLGSAAPMSRHLIFILPFFALVISEGLLRVASIGRRAAPIIAVAAVLALLPAEVAWGWHRTPELYRGQPGAQVSARDAAASWLAARSQPSDVLFGYEPLYVQAWDDGGKVSKLVVPRADPKLALDALESARKPLGHGVWVLDASDTTNDTRTQSIPLVSPQPASEFQVARFGPYLVIRSVQPAGCTANYLKLARRVELVGASLGLGDGDINLGTVLQAERLLDAEKAPAPC